MSAEPDAGIDKQKILAAITHPDPLPFPSAAPAPGVPSRPSSSATGRAVSLPESRWVTYRAELSAIIVTFVSLVWIAAGVAAGAGGPILIGVLFGIGGLAIWLLEVWSGD
jgi:hypothetical protein